MTVDFKIWDIIFSPPAVAAIAAQFSSQAFKVFKPLVKGKPPDFTKIADYGGWPSAHTAFITGVTVAVGLTEGFKSGVFAVAGVTAAILIYDIIKQRRALEVTMKTTEALLAKNGLEWTEKPPQFKSHSLMEVVSGALWGAAVAVITCMVWPAV